MANIKSYDSVRHAMAKRLVLAVGLACAWMQVDAIAKDGCEHLNYDENKVGDYTVPDPLLGKDGKRVTDATSWRDKRRNEILRDFRDLMYGHTPELPLKLRAQVVATRRDAVDGLATRTIVKSASARAVTPAGSWRSRTWTASFTFNAENLIPVSLFLNTLLLNKLIN